MILPPPVTRFENHVITIEELFEHALEKSTVLARFLSRFIPKLASHGGLLTEKRGEGRS